MRALILPLLFLGACGGPSSGPSGDGPGSTPPSTPPTLAVVAPSSIAPFVDAVHTSCAAGDGRWTVETIGHADTVTVDVLADMVTTLEGRLVSEGDDVVWRRFDGEASCEALDGATLVIRADRDGQEVDCAVHGPGRGEALTGQHDAALVTAGRPRVDEACHDISRR
mgnify:CR=1 FL=1